MAAPPGAQGIPAGPPQTGEAQASSAQSQQQQQQHFGDPINKAKIYMSQLKENLAVRILQWIFSTSYKVQKKLKARAKCYVFNCNHIYNDTKYL